MSFEIVKGNLFDPNFDFEALAQGVNTWGVMGAGIAVPFRENWPEMYAEYRKICKRFGADLCGSAHIWWTDNHRVIYNLFSQKDPGPDGSYDYLRKATVQMVLHAEKEKLRSVGLPWIGCGIAGLKHHNVKEIFEDILGPSFVDFTLVEQ